MNQSRRTFLRQGGLLAGGLIAAPALLARSAPSDTIRVGLIGCRNMGFGDLSNCLQQENVICGGLCDVDEEVLMRRAKDIEETYGIKPPLYRDFRKMLEDPELDAVVIGTPDHWHCLITIMACEAGKAVYVEKPLANSIAECQAMVSAVRHHGSIVQVGQQQRSGQHWQDVAAYVQSGKLGQIRRVMVWGNFAYGKGNPRIPNVAVPKNLDYNLWLGPSAHIPYNPNRLHGAWRHTWAFGGGLLTDWGVHLLDIVLWTMKSSLPKRVSAFGGIYQYPNNLIETPDTLDVTWDMGTYNLTWSHVAGNELKQFGRTYGIAFMGADGVLVVNRQGWEVQAPNGAESDLLKPFEVGKDSNHLAHAADFIQAMRENRDPICNIEAGRDAAVLAQYGIVALRSGQTLTMGDDPYDLSHQPDAQAFAKPTYHSGWTFPHW